MHRRHYALKPLAGLEFEDKRRREVDGNWAERVYGGDGHGVSDRIHQELP